MMKDSNGLSYLTEENKGEEILFTKHPKKEGNNDNSLFYKVIGNEDLIIKYSLKEFNQLKLYEMLIKFQEIKDKIIGTDLPTSYYVENNELRGTIVPYYKNSISLYQSAKNQSLYTLQEYYKHDDDKIHNLYLLCFDILDKLEKQ